MTVDAMPADPPPTMATIDRIAVGTDGSDTAMKAVDFAIDLASRCGSELVVASSYEPVGEARLQRERDETPEELQWSVNPTEDVEAVLREVEERAAARGLRVTSEARVGEPATVLCEVAGEHAADLLVVGSRGMHRKHLPSVPNSVSHRAPCSVLIVKTV